MNLFGQLGESTSLNKDRGKSRSLKVTLSIQKRISKGLGRIFRRFREIRQNLTKNQGINKYLSLTLSPTLSEDFFCWQAILSISPILSLTLSPTLSEDLFCWASDLVSSSSVLSPPHFSYKYLQIQRQKCTTLSREILGQVFVLVQFRFFFLLLYNFIFLYTLVQREFHERRKRKIAFRVTMNVIFF